MAEVAMDGTDGAQEAGETDIVGWVVGRTADSIPGHALSNRRRLEVQQLWGTTLLASRSFEGGHGAVRIGAERGQRWRFLGIDMGLVPTGLAPVLPWIAPGWSEVEGAWASDFVVDADALPDRTSFPLFEIDAAGDVTASITAGWDGWVERAGERLTWEALAARGEARATPDGFRVPIPDGVELVVSCGGCVFVARRVAPPLRARTVDGEPPDRVLTGALLAGLAVFLGAIGLVSTTPPSRSAETRELPPALVEMLLQVPEPPVVQVAAASPEPGAAKARGDEGRAGPKDPKRTDRRPPPSDRQVARQAGLLSVLEGPSAALLSESGLGDQLQRGVSGLIGSTGSGPGDGGLGQRGDDLGGGGVAESLGGVDPRGTRDYGPPSGPGKQEGSLAGEPREAVVLGPLDRALIDEVVKRNLPSLRYCYQRELPKHPELAGKAVVKFTISGDGSVSAASIRSSTLGEPAVDQCLVGRFLRMDFPEPKAGGTVVVSYPFLFTAH